MILKNELNSLTPPDDLIIPSELTTFLFKTSSNNNNITTTTDQVTPSCSSTVTTTTVNIPSISDINKKSEQNIDSTSTDEHSIEIKIVPNLQYQSPLSSAAATIVLPTTLIERETQQSSNSSNDHYEQQQNQSLSTNRNTYDVTITHSNSLISDWTSTDTPNVPLPDDELIYDDLLYGEDDLDIEDMLEYEGEIPEGYPKDFY
ncbi:unnamed protein product [Rotaria sp. Silwood2]|nr:unnamed protein product [Rotaria sp. Silwood2]CAF2625053.1 unnamed protein product [Rotaria sp. Silwood2]CAF3281064.1 unnamed protein product [Rotaria sp. Silwood2]CAF3352642.1 unnamed protein product [Rotaria sp. Silwood2]CAF4170140.1 unnamed protein product [Rotaria sp. Silwood2]